jgi:hypothetical protein
MEWKDLNPTQMNKSITIWVHSLTGGVKIWLKNLMEANLTNKNA